MRGCPAKGTSPHVRKLNTIRMYHDRGIEKSILSITKWHNEACLGMTVIARGRFFYPILTRIMDSLSFSPLNTVSFYV